MTRHTRTRRTIGGLATGAMTLALLPAAALSAQEAGVPDDDAPSVCDGADTDRFDDTDGSTFEADIDCIASYGITQGVTEDRYAPNDDTLRGQMASFITRFIETGQDDELPPGQSAFLDIIGTQHEDNINKLFSAGVVEGISTTEYQPNGEVTRAQMASFVARAMTEFGFEFDDDADSGFDDVEGTTHEDNIDRLADEGIVAGFGDGTFRPSDDVTRGQMARFLVGAADVLDQAGLWEASLLASAEYQVGLSWFDEVATDGDEVVSGTFAVGDHGQPGLNGAEGDIDLQIDPADGTVTYDVTYDQVDGPFGDADGLHIHRGDRDDNGPIVVTLASGDQLDDADGQLSGTVTVPTDPGEADVDLTELVDAPEDFYVNLHSDAYPNGAIRGQLPDGPPAIADGEETSSYTIVADPLQASFGADDPDQAGQEGASATIEVTVDADRDVLCYDITADGLDGDYVSDAKTATHIHQAPVGEAGEARVALRNPTGDGDQRTASGCHLVPQQVFPADQAADGDPGEGFTLADLEANPEDYYIDIHTDEAPQGAIRGQFVAVDVPDPDADAAELTEATAFTDDAEAFGAQGDALTLTFDGPLEGGLGTDEDAIVAFGDAQEIPCSAATVECTVAGNELTLLAESDFSSTRDLSDEIVTDVPGLDDFNGNAVVVDEGGVEITIEDRDDELLDDELLG